MATPNDPSTPTSRIDSEAAPPETAAAVVEPAERIADRPHRLTLFASFGAVALSLTSLLVSLGSLYFIRLSLHVGQRAYLSYAPTFPECTDDPNASENDTLLLPAEVEIKNLGNTPAYNVRPAFSPQNPDSGYKIISYQSPIPTIGPKETAHFQINISGSRRSYRNSLGWPGAAPSMCISAAYTDVFGEEQSDSACFSPTYKVSIVGYSPPLPAPSK